MTSRALTSETTEAERFFGRHASAYLPDRGRFDRADLDRLLDVVEPLPTDDVLDVGTGTGQLALTLAPRVRAVIGVDVTEGMLGKARQAARDRGLHNVRFERGNATRLRWKNAEFDLVVSRRAAHHFTNVNAFLAETVRVLRPAGRFGLADMCSPELDGGLLDLVERTRDPSHRHALSPEEWSQTLPSHGLRLRRREILEQYLPIAAWLSPVAEGSLEEAGVRRVLSAASIQDRRALGVREQGGIIDGWTKQRIVLVALRIPRADGARPLPTF